MSDLIEREEVIDAICNKCMFEHKMERRMPTLCRNCRTVKMIQAIPSARPQGEWIDAEIPLESGDTMPIQVCNLCKTFYPLAYTGGGHRFCPNCGARMKGADDGADNI